MGNEDEETASSDDALGEKDPAATCEDIAAVSTTPRGTWASAKSIDPPQDTEQDVDGETIDDLDGEALDEVDGEALDDIDGESLGDIDGDALDDSDANSLDGDTVEPDS